MVTLHKNEFVPTLSESTALAGLVDEISEAPPERTVQEPFPRLGETADNVAVEIHTVWSMPALATGITSRIIVTVELAEGQTPLATVQTNALVPVLKALTAEEGFVELATLAVPVKTDQLPAPAVGTVAASVIEAAQTVWSVPAKAVGCISLKILTVDVAGGQEPLVTVHTNWLVPVDKAEIAEEGFVTEASVPLPESRVQEPEPIVGLSAESVAEELQSV